MDLQDYITIAVEIDNLVDDIFDLFAIRRRYDFRPTSSLPESLQATEQDILYRIRRQTKRINEVTAILETCMELSPKKLQLSDEEARKTLSYGVAAFGGHIDGDPVEYIIAEKVLNKKER